MALFKPGFGISALSGKIGGTIYSRSRTGAYAKAWADPTNPGTPDQVDKEEIWIDMSAAYNSLSIDQLTMWREYANQLVAKNRLGESYTPQARNVFSECYTNAALCGLTPLTEPTEFTNRPALIEPGNFVAQAVEPSMKHLTLDIPIAIAASGFTPTVIIYSAPCTPPTIRNVNNKFRMMTAAPVDGSVIEWRDEYNAKFPNTAIVGTVAHAKLRVIDSFSMLGSTRYLTNVEVTT